MAAVHEDSRGRGGVSAAMMVLLVWTAGISAVLLIIMVSVQVLRGILLLADSHEGAVCVILLASRVFDEGILDSSHDGGILLLVRRVS